jgi:hydrogenase expression/formation protein HypC
MCIGTPMEILACADGVALAAGRGEEARLDVLLLDDPQPGTWVLAFRGVALRALSAEEAAQTNAALDALEQVLAGESVVSDAHFRDLVDREPRLPAHLRGEHA